MKSTWPPESYESPNALPLRPRPGILRRPQVCPTCQAVHVSAEEVQRCQQQAAWREQA